MKKFKLLTALGFVIHANSLWANPSLLLKRELGMDNPRLSNSLQQSCTLTAEQTQAAERAHRYAKKAGGEKISESMMFRAIVPSYKYSIVLEGKEIVLSHGFSSLKERQGPNSQALIQLIDLICGRYDMQKNAASKPFRPTKGSK